MLFRSRCSGRALACAGVIALATLVAPGLARARCSGDLAGIETLIGAGLVTFPTSLVATFLVPAIAVAADPSLNYGGGVGWSAVGAVSMGLTATTIIGAECAESAFYGPAIMSLGGAILSTTAWAIGSQDTDPNPPFAASIAPTASGDGAIVTIGGRF